MASHPFNDQESRVPIFSITYKNGSRTYTLGVERTWKGDRLEEFTVKSINKPWLKIKIQNNRPYLREILGLKNKKIAWKVLEGEIRNKNAYEAVIELIEQEIEKYPLSKKISR